MKSTIHKVNIDADSYRNDRQCWADYVQAHPQGTVFQSPEMFALYEQTPKHEPLAWLATDERGRITGVLLAVVRSEHRGWLGKFSARALLLGAPLVDEPAVAAQLLSEFDACVGSRIVYAQARNLFDCSDLKPVFERQGYLYETHLNILIDLTRTAEQLRADLHKGRRRNLSRAEHRGLTFRECTEQAEIEASVELIKRTYRRIRLPLPDAVLFRNAKRELGDRIRFFAAYSGGEMAASRTVLCYGNRVYDWFTGSNERLNRLYPNDFLTWQVILWARANGYDIFDFGGAGKPDEPYGVRTFKSRFGGKQVEYGRYLRVFKPLIYQLGKFVIGK